MKALKYLLITISIQFIFSVSLFSQNCEPKNVVNTLEEPFRYVCYIKKTTFRDKTYTTTGFLVAPRILLTNAHNVYNAKKYDISPAHSGQGKDLLRQGIIFPFGITSLQRTEKNTFYPEQFEKSQRKRSRMGLRHLDFAIIILPDSSLYKALGGHLQMADCDVEATKGDSIFFIGYSGRPNYSLFQQTNNGVLDGYYEDSSMIRYRMGTRKGASGSPVLINKNGFYKVIGIHGYGSGCKNSGIKITSEVINRINSWIRL